MKRFAATAVLAAAAIGLGGAPATAAPPASASVGADGNALTGGLAFSPSATAVGLGGTVRWTNHDSLEPHTVTSDDGLFNLGGSWRGLLGTDPPGLKSGASVQFTFSDAGTFRYRCQIHPAQMRGSVGVPDTVSVVGGRHHRHVSVSWASTPPPPGAVFDVQRRYGKTWKYVYIGTPKTSRSFGLKGGRFRSRLRFGDDFHVGFPWSPPAGR
jgi:plastocyanin